MITGVHVLLKQCIGAEATRTFSARKRGTLLARMILHMAFESAKRRGTLVALWDCNNSRNLLFLCLEFLLTLGAGEGTQMRLGMCAQLCGLNETFAALVALVRTLACVTLHVAIEHLLDSKGLTALKGDGDYDYD